MGMSGGTQMDTVGVKDNRRKEMMNGQQVASGPAQRDMMSTSGVRSCLRRHDRATVSGRALEDAAGARDESQRLNVLGRSEKRHWRPKTEQRWSMMHEERQCSKVAIGASFGHSRGKWKR